MLHELKLTALCHAWWPSNLAVVFFLSAYPASAQFFNLDFDVYNTESGLPQNHIMSITQDKYGFMWFGTENGLARFDGNEFKVYKSSEIDLNTLADNNVRALMEDDSGVLWIGTNYGVSKYYPETDFVERLPVDFTAPSKLNGSQVSSIKKGPDGKIWITYIGDGVDVVIPGETDIMHYTINRYDEYQIKNDLVQALQFMPDGDVLLGIPGGIQVIDRSGYVLTEDQMLKKYPWKNHLTASVSCLLLSDNGKKLWIGTELEGLYVVDLEARSLRNFNKANSPIGYNHILSLFEDSAGNVWVGSEVLYLFDEKKEALVPYTEYGIQGNMVVKNPIYSIYEDREKNIWLGTYRIGALKFNPGNTKVLHYHTNQGEGSIKSDEILSFAEDSKNGIWVGTGGGLFKLRSDLKGFDEAPKNLKFSSQTIKSIYKDKEDYFWLGTWDGGLMKYHPFREELELFHPAMKNFESRHVWAIKKDSIDNLWLGTLRDGLCYFSTKTYQYRYYKYVAGDSSQLVGNDVLCLLIDSRNRVWAGTGNGLSVLHPGKTAFVNFQKKDNSKSIASNIVFCLFEDENGKVWAGTNGGGITIFNPDLSIEKTLTTGDGLPSNTVTAIQYDDKKNIWFSTYNGLGRLLRGDTVITGMPQITGLQGKEFIPGAYFTTADGRFLFGGVNGFNLFHPDSLTLDQTHEEVVFTSLKILNDEILPGKLYDGREILSKSITVAEEVQLSYKDYSFTVSFAPLTYNWQNDLNYSYYLENFDKEWQYTTSDKRFAHYTNLAPGSYVLKVKASFDGKHWSNSASQLKIYIAPPWWATVWFRVGAAFLLIGTLYSLYRGRVRFLNIQKKKLETLVALRTSELLASNQELELKSAELEKTQLKIRETNSNLELLVLERTQKLNNALEELETFLYRASHDLRGPLSSMRGIVNLAQIEKDGQPLGNWANDAMLKVILQLDHTLQKLMMKYTIQQRSIVPERINKPSLEAILMEIETTVPCFRANDLTVLVDEDIELETDRTMLKILLSNLLENAFFYSEKATNRQVIFSTGWGDSGVIITVSDFGLGIRDEFKDKIFTMFFRGNEYSPGSGLGLYLVKSVLDKINGKIALETQEGKFSRFTVSI